MVNGYNVLHAHLSPKFQIQIPNGKRDFWNTEQETAGVQLPDTVAEAEQFGIGQEFFHLPGLKKRRDRGEGEGGDVAIKA